MKRFVKFLFALMLGVLCMPGVCLAKEEIETVPIYGNDIKDGSYEVEMESSSSMFRIVKAKLHVSKGNLTVDMTLGGTGYLKLFMGTGEEALKSGEENFIPYVEDAEGAYTYTIPVEAVNQEFDCAAFSKRKQQWYDRKLLVSGSSLPEDALSEGPVEIQQKDGNYAMEVTLNGGTGRASVTSPARIVISGGEAFAFIEWSSPDYDYMIVNGTQYFPTNEEGNSVFEIPVLALDQEMDVVADTVAMSTPHEIAYTLTFHSDTLQDTEKESGNIAAALCLIALLMAAGVSGYVRKQKGKRFVRLLLVLSVLFWMTGCRAVSSGREETAAGNDLQDRSTDISRELVWQESMELSYADRFAVDYYEGGYASVSAADGRQYLVIPEGKEVPGDLKKDIVVLKRPLENIYLVATAVMDMFCELDALDFIRFSGQKPDGWCRKEPREEMEKGNILYAGKYSAPDYERIVSEGCSLAIENNMISHSPEVVEKLAEFEIPVLVDLSSYEKHPLGRVEWIRLYGVLLGKEEAAKAIFDEQVRDLDEVVKEEASNKTAAYFSITANKTVNVRVSSDYIPKMIELAGGKYVFENLVREDSNRSTMTMQMEDFYLAAKDADYLIYNSTIEGEIKTLEELLEQEELLGDFKAVQEGNVWCTTRDLYQQSMSIGQMIEDFHNMLSGEPVRQEEIQFLYRLE